MTVKQKVGWKVVGPYRKSSVMFGYYGARSYPKRRKIIPTHTCGPLCVFKTRKAALKFVGGDISKVLKCLYVPSKTKKVWDNSHSLRLDELPSHTALADSVTCLE